MRAQAIATGYGNAFEAIRAQLPWRPRLVDNTGARRNVKPSYNQLVFDDSNGQLRTQLATMQHASQLNLGRLIHQAVRLRPMAHGKRRREARRLANTITTDAASAAWASH